MFSSKPSEYQFIYSFGEVRAVSSFKTSFRSFVAVMVAAVLLLVPINLSGASAEQTADIITITWEGNATPVEVADQSVVELPQRTASVVVSTIPLVEGSTTQVVGDTGLREGRNELVVTITTNDVPAVTTVYLDVALTTYSTKLESVRVNGQNIGYVDTQDSRVFDWFDLARGTSQVLDVVAVPVDSLATVTVSVQPEAGCSAESTPSDFHYSAGYCVLLIQIDTSTPDGQTDRQHIHAYLPKSDTITLNWEGNTTPVQVFEGDVVYLPSRTTQVAVAVTTEFESAKVDIEGATDLEVGRNELFVTITNDDLVKVTKMYLDVAEHSAELVSVSVNDETANFDAEGKAIVNLPHGSTLLDVLVETVDPDATYEVEILDEKLDWAAPSCELDSTDCGQAIVNVTVTAPGGVTSSKQIQVYVARSENVETTAVAVNGQVWDLSDAPVEVDAGEVEISVDTENEFARTEITVATTESSVGGNFTLVGNPIVSSGSNHLLTASGFVTASIVVIAQDGTRGDPIVLNLIASTDLGVYNGSNPSDDTLRVGTFAKVSSDAVAEALKLGGKVNNRWLVDGAYAPGQITSRLLLTPEDREVEIRPVVFTANEILVGKQIEVALGIIRKAPVPTVLGKASVGNTLKAMPKVWTEGVEFSYKWFVNYEEGADSEAVATEADFLLAADVVSPGDIVTLSVTGSLEGYAPTEVFSRQLTVVTGTLKLSTKPELTTDKGFVTGGTISLATGETSAEAEVAVAWYRNGALVPEQTDVEYVITPADFKSKLTAKITYTAEDYHVLTVKVNTPFIKAGLLEEIEAPAIEEVKVDEVLTALRAVGGYSADVATTKINYVWYRNGRVVLDAKGENYVLRIKDKGAKITVRVVASYLGYSTTSSAVDPEEGFYLVPKQ